MNILDMVLKGTSIVDNMTESPQERQQTLSKRHANDMNSDNWLSKSIRPLSVLVLLVVICIMGIASCFGYNADPVLFGELVVLLGTAFGFYFSSRKREKIAFMEAKAAVTIERDRNKLSLVKDRKNIRQIHRQERRKERKQEKEDYK